MTLCYSDVETREALCRLREVAFSFGHCIEPVEINSDINIIHNFVAMLREREEKRKIWHRQSPQVFDCCDNANKN